MFDWFRTMNWFEQLLWIISILSTILFFYQIILALFKKTPEKSRKHLFSRFFSFHNIVAFLSMFGWTSISGLYQGVGIATSLLLGIVSGLILMSIMTILFYYMYELRQERHKPMNPSDLLSTGEAISHIGKKRSNTGSIKIRINGVRQIKEAMTDFENDIVKGTKIKVESITENDIYIIKPL